MKTASIFVVPAVLVLLLAGLLRALDPAPIANLRLAVFDTYLRAAPRVADKSLPVKIIAVDEASLAKLGQWPWPRNILADVTNRLSEAGAKTISFDIIMPEPDRLSPSAIAAALPSSPKYEAVTELISQLPSNDEKFARQIALSPVVMGFSGDNKAEEKIVSPKAGVVVAGDLQQNQIPFYSAGISSLTRLVKPAPGFGAVNWLPDKDLLVRRVPLVVSVAGVRYPSLSLEALRLAKNETTVFVRASGGGMSNFGQQTGVEFVRVAKTVLPTNSRGELWLKFAPPDPKRYVSAHKVLQPDFDANLVKDRHVFIGATAAGLLDLRATPLADVVPGVEIHAQALEQMLAGNHILRPAFATGYELLFLIIGAAVVAWLIPQLGPLNAALIGISAIVAVGIGSWFAYANAGLLFDPVYPSLALIAVYLATSLPRFIKTERERYRVRKAFSNYIAPSLVAELERNHDKLKLGGETRTITLLFSDVRGFSGISEGKSAEELVKFINELFTPLSDVIIEERGTIDKFMGDAVMAFWNAPVADPDHARQSCRAALRMLDELEKLNDKWAARAAEHGESFNPVRIGIGLNTGACCVGNVGSPQRFDYSILGDVVNIASRLEATTKAYGTPVVMGRETAEAAKDFAILEIDKVVLRGKSQPEEVFALFGDEALAQSQPFTSLRSTHGELMKAIRSTNLPAAKKAIAECRASTIASYQPLADFYEQKITKQDV